jgi:hypothetical protein
VAKKPAAPRKPAAAKKPVDKPEEPTPISGFPFF